MQLFRELISEARKINTDNQVTKKLERAESKLKGKFIEFPNYQSAVLEISKFNKGKKKDWRSFFDIFRIMRNSAHDNFTCTETRTLRWKGHTITFVEGESVDVRLSCLKRIIDELLKFFELIES